MNKNLLKIASFAISSNRNLIFSPTIKHSHIYITSSLYPQTPISFLNFRCFTSKNSSPIQNPDQLSSDSGLGRPQNPEVEDFSKEELKAQIERYLAGDAEAIPDIFEGILKRKLAGTHDESDDELMQNFRHIPINNAMDKDVSDEDISDGDSSDASDADFGIKTPDSDVDEFYKSD